ncbi:MAG: rRNA maturation RNase YbeY [Anaerolineae bacterium]|nr:rRNA maturation RNase YbeY [Anaerolineae bacterium]
MTAPAHGIDVQNEADWPMDADALARAALVVLAQEGRDPRSAITVVVTDNDAVAALNREFRGIDAPTDVLSFPADPLPPELASAMADEPPYLGDLIIAFPYASAQAEREHHPLTDSLMLLVAHGTLHLLGYDHNTPEARAVMWAAQDRALTTLGISTALVPALEEANHGGEH